MTTFTEKFEYLIDEIKGKLIDLIEKHKIEQNYSSSYCLPIKNENFMFNLEGGRYVVEVTSSQLINNQGYIYDHSQLEIEQYIKLIDHLIEQYT